MIGDGDLLRRSDAEARRELGLGPATVVLGPREHRRCPGCGRYMSYREEDEQGACNDCNGGAWGPGE